MTSHNPKRVLPNAITGNDTCRLARSRFLGLRKIGKQSINARQQKQNSNGYYQIIYCDIGPQDQQKPNDQRTDAAHDSITYRSTSYAFILIDNTNLVYSFHRNKLNPNFVTFYFSSGISKTDILSYLCNRCVSEHPFHTTSCRKVCTATQQAD